MYDGRRKPNSQPSLLLNRYLSDSDEEDSVSNETTKSVDAALLELYEKIRTGGGSGAAPLKGGQCGGCHLSINAVELKRILDLSEDEVVRCEECRCILVRGV